MALSIILRIFFRNEVFPDIYFPLTDSGDGLFSLEVEQELLLPNGERLMIYSEVRPEEDPQDISLSISQNNRDIDIRCRYGLVVSFQTEEGMDVLFQIGADVPNSQ